MFVSSKTPALIGTPMFMSTKTTLKSVDSYEEQSLAGTPSLNDIIRLCSYVYSLQTFMTLGGLFGERETENQHNRGEFVLESKLHKVCSSYHVSAGMFKEAWFRLRS